MSQKEVDRALFLDQVKKKQITLKRASELLRLSYPQTKRLWSRYKQHGCKGLISKKKGDRKGKTQFGRAMQELEINTILAHSPQAKGRIERVFGTLQERLVWEMRIHQINTIEEANLFLPSFFKEYNQKFAIAASNSVNAYRPLNQSTNLKYILCTKEIRKITKNLEIQYNNQIYQLIPPKHLRTRLKGAYVVVITTLENELLFEYEGVILEYKRYNEVEYQEPSICRGSLLANWKGVSGRKTKPGKSHPWKNNRRAA